MKELAHGDFLQAWGRIASLQLGLPAVWHGARKRGLTVAQVCEWMSVAPARLAGLERHKGRLASGFDADIVVWNPDAPVAVHDTMLHQRHPLTPYRGRTLTGAVRATYVGGVQVYLDGEVAEEKARPSHQRQAGPVVLSGTKHLHLLSAHSRPDDRLH